MSMNAVKTAMAEDVLVNTLHIRSETRWMPERIKRHTEGAKNKTKLCDMICNDEWKLSKQWTTSHPQLNSIPIPNFVECDDKVMWENNEGEV
ncbi:hypothetical protein Tco_1305457, partial [Tanacetum coccineum]